VCVLKRSGGGVVSCNSVIFFFFCNNGNDAHFSSIDGSFSLPSHLPLHCCYRATSSMVHRVFSEYGLGANVVLLGASMKVGFYIIKGK